MKNYFFEMLELSKLGYGSYIVSIVKSASKKIGTLIFSFFFLVATYLVMAVKPCTDWISIKYILTYIY